MQNMSFSRSKMSQNVIFECKQIFKFLKDENFLIQNLTRCIFFSLQNLTRCKTFKSKSDALYIFYFKIWHVV